MGIYGALSTAVTGLRAQSFALENISGNIANSQTTGYKRVETDFVDLIPDAPTKRQVSGAVLAQSRSTNTIGGDIKTASTETFMAVNGSGFFVVEPKIGQADGQAQFAGTNFYTRRGDFDLDKSGFLVNGAGNYLKGLPIDKQTGNVSGSVPEVIKLSNGFLPASPTTRVQYQLNLPQKPQNPGAEAGVVGSELLVPANYANNPTTGTAGNGFVRASDSDLFLENSIAGGAVTVYSPNGSPASVQLRWAKIASSESGGTDTWNMFYLQNSAATGTAPMWRNADPATDYTFGADGSPTPAVASTTIAGMTVNGVNVGDITVDFGTKGLTQFADADGSATAELKQNGFGAGEYMSVVVNENGRIAATYTNGQQVEIAQVVTANFNGAEQLKRMDGGLFAATSESGEPIFNATGDGVLGAALESSNTDISEEFTKLIVTQQAYAAGTRIVSTADQMMQEALNMVR
ncbi:MAG: flagellar hook protein FlgE [Devosia sp.]|nr:flagellar hook protein FlgE [Devosia sp.]